MQGSESWIEVQEAVYAWFGDTAGQLHKAVTVKFSKTVDGSSSKVAVRQSSLSCLLGPHRAM